jgi:hypothetical protein
MYVKFSYTNSSIGEDDDDDDGSGGNEDEKDDGKVIESILKHLYKFTF